MGGGVARYDPSTGKYTNAFAPGKTFNSLSDAIGPQGLGMPDIPVAPAPAAATPEQTAPVVRPGTGPVLQDGTAIPGAEDMDLTKLGAAEKFFKKTQDVYTTPGRGDKFADAILGQFGYGTNIPHTSNNAQDAYNSFLRGPTSAGLDPYYQNANRISDEGINKALSARGLYGSSAADDQIRESHQNLAADEANRNADFDLRRATTLGNLASAADTSSVNAQANNRSWLEGLGNLASGTDTADLNRTIAGQNAAGAAQTHQDNRIENAFNNSLNFGDRLSAIMGGANSTATGTDVGLNEDVTNTRLGQAADSANAAAARAASENTANSNAIGAAAGAAKATTGVIDSINSPSTNAAAKTASVPYVQSAASQYPGVSSEPWNQY